MKKRRRAIGIAIFTIFLVTVAYVVLTESSSSQNHFRSQVFDHVSKTATFKESSEWMYTITPKGITKSRTWMIEYDQPLEKLVPTLIDQQGLPTKPVMTVHQEDPVTGLSSVMFPVPHHAADPASMIIYPATRTPKQKKQTSSTLSFGRYWETQNVPNIELWIARLTRKTVYDTTGTTPVQISP